MTPRIDYEKMGMFYLGREISPQDGSQSPVPLLVKGKDFTTHTAIIGMTGSGKTGLGISLIEEAAIDGIPSIVIDPKGDMGNLLLTFPELRPRDFEPWIDPGIASSKNLSLSQYAEQVAANWREGLQNWDQAPSRISLFEGRTDRTIYTPGSSSGIPVSLLSGFEAPSIEVLNDTDLINSMVNSTVTGLLALIGKEAEPLKSREHLLLSCIILHYWRNGENLSMEKLIGSVVSPPFDKIGVFGLEAFYGQPDRMQLAMELNNILASPQFSSWLQGVPLDIQNILYTAEGKPRTAIFSIAHLSDPERMFFVTLLLNAFLAWMRRRQGTDTLRTLLYMDEIHGYFPPLGNPPSKKPMMLLLKQARAFGVGVVLATQNPVDLDYKGLSNIGSWFIGRLQTRQDQDRVIDGLSSSADAPDTATLRKLLAGLKSRTFLLRSIHLDTPLVFQTRWALSYLKGPITREDIRRLSSNETHEEQSPATPSPSETNAGPQSSGALHPPLLSRNIEQWYYTPPVPAESFLLQPWLLATASVRFYNGPRNIDVREQAAIRLPLDEQTRDLQWLQGEKTEITTYAPQQPPSTGCRYAPLPQIIAGLNDFNGLAKDFSEYLYRNSKIILFRVKSLKLESEPEESPAAFKARIAEALRVKKEEAQDKIRAQYLVKQQRLEDQLLRAQDRIEKEQEDVTTSKVDTALSFGVAFLGSLLGRKTFSMTTAGRAATGIRKAGKIMKERGDVQRAEEMLVRVQEDLENLQRELGDELAAVERNFLVEKQEVETFDITPRRMDIFDVRCVLLWEAVPDLPRIDHPG